MTPQESRLAEDAVTAYQRRRPEVERAAEGLVRVLTALIADADVNYLSIEARVKSVDSFRNKCLKVRSDGIHKYTNPDTEIHDVLAARVITYLPEAVDRVCDIVRREFDIVGESDKGRETRERGVFGYASKHLEARLNQGRRDLPEYRKFGDQIFEIQVRTAVQHAWAEFEHDLRYKGAIPADRKAEVDRRFLLAAALIEMADNEFTEIDRMFRDLAKQAPAPETTIREPAEATASRPVSRTALNRDSLTAYLSRRYPEAPRSKADQYETTLMSLARLGIHTVEELEETVVAVPSEQVAAAMSHPLPAGQIRRLEDDLLAAKGQRYVAAAAGAVDSGAERARVLSRRWERLRHEAWAARTGS